MTTYKIFHRKTKYVVSDEELSAATLRYKFGGYLGFVISNISLTLQRWVEKVFLNNLFVLEIALSSVHTFELYPELLYY